MCLLLPKALLYELTCTDKALWQEHKIIEVILAVSKSVSFLISFLSNVYSVFHCIMCANHFVILFERHFWCQMFNNFRVPSPLESPKFTMSRKSWQLLCFKRQLIKAVVSFFIYSLAAGDDMWHSKSCKTLVHECFSPLVTKSLLKPMLAFYRCGAMTLTPKQPHN